MKLDHKKLLRLISDSIETIASVNSFTRGESYCIGQIGKVQINVEVGLEEDLLQNISGSECICLTNPNIHAVALGKRTSPKKATAVRKNGKLGGRPRSK